jgi:hypothetical protein
MRGVVLALVWLVATAAATGLAWAGVRSVATDVAAPLPPVVTTGPTDAPVDPAPTTPPTSTARTRTFETTGGTATVRFSAAEVEVLGAVPAAGFTVDLEPEDDGSARVDFESEDHRSRLRVWWSDGPRHEIEEQARDDDGDDEDDTSGDRSGPSGSGGSDTRDPDSSDDRGSVDDGSDDHGSDDNADDADDRGSDDDGSDDDGRRH